jgi:hypothetical protein
MITAVLVAELMNDQVKNIVKISRSAIEEPAPDGATVLTWASGSILTDGSG